MATVDGFTAGKMQEIADDTVVAGFVDSAGHLLLEKRGGGQINAGEVKGAKGDPGESYQYVAGVVEFFAGSVPPPGWMICNGASLLRSQYPELFAAIGTAYGSSGPTTFNIPDMRGLAAVGMDLSQTEFNNLGKKGGAKTHTLSIDEMPSHSHQWAASGNNNITATPQNWDDVASGNSNALGVGPSNPEGADNGIRPRGGSQPHNNLQPYGVFHYIISLGTAGAVGGGTPVEAQYIGRGSTGERDALFGVPGTDPQRVALANTKPLWYNTDLGWFETYYAPSNLAGLGVRGLIVHANIPARWYPVESGPRAVLFAAGQQSLSSGGTFSNWKDFGATSADPSEDSWKNTPGNDNLGNAIIHKATNNAAVQFFLAGRWRTTFSMHYPAGSGTAVCSVRATTRTGPTAERINMFPVPLLGGYGQIVRNGFDDMLFGNTGFVYYKVDAGTLPLGTQHDTWAQFEYLGPPLANVA